VRISIVAPIFEPLGGPQPYGPHAVLIDLARGLSGRGHDVVVHCAAGSDVPGLRLRPIAVEPEVRESRVLSGRPVVPSGSVRRAFARLYGDVRATRPEAVSQHAFDAEAIDLAEGLPVVHTLHLGPVVPSVVMAATRSSARLVTVSAAARRDWLAAGVANVGVIRNGVSFAPIRSPVAAIALIAGRVSPEKGVATAIRVGHRAGLRPVVVGAVHDERYFREEVEPLMHLAEHVPTVPRSELAAMMAGATVLLMPSEGDETFGLVAAEAQMAGCPVVGYRRGALPEVVEEGVSGVLVDPGDEDALVRAIGAARTFDREAVRRSAERRLGIAATLRAYERELALVASGGKRGARRATRPWRRPAPRAG
jgi:glycosyltransferase involved in cell wall biosynthesis